MIRLRFTSRGLLVAALGGFAFLLGSLLNLSILNLSGYVLWTLLAMALIIGLFEMRGLTLQAVATRVGEPGDETLVWARLLSTRRAGPYGLSLKQGRLWTPDRCVHAPDAAGIRFQLSGPPPPKGLVVRLRALPLGLLTVAKLARPTWLADQEELETPVPLPNPQGLPQDPSGAIRDHRPGEGIRDVHWPVSARRQKLVVRVREPEPEPRSHARPQGSLPEAPAEPPRPQLLRIMTCVASVGAIAFMGEYGVLSPILLVVAGLVMTLGAWASIKREGRPGLGVQAMLYLGMLAAVIWYASDLKAHILAKAPIAIPLAAVIALFVWDLRDRTYIRAQHLFLILVLTLLPAFLPARETRMLGILYAITMLALILASWADSRHQLGSARVSVRDLRSFSSSLIPLGAVVAIAMLAQPWLPSVPLPPLPSFNAFAGPGMPNLSSASMPGQEGSLALNDRWPTGTHAVLKSRPQLRRLRSEVFDTYQDGYWLRSLRETKTFPTEPGGQLVSFRLLTNDVRVLTLPEEAQEIVKSPLRPTWYADGMVRLRASTWQGYRYVVRTGTRGAYATEPPVPSERSKQNTPLALREIARDFAGAAPTAREAMIALVMRLRQEYAYDLDAPQAPKGKDPTLHFLTKSRKGFCLHFASALVLLGRELDIPTRLVSGYAGDGPGDWEGTYTEGDAHAWVEAYVDGRWEAFDPTPAAPASGSGWKGARVGAIGLIVIALGLRIWLGQRQPRAVRHYRRMLGRLRRKGAPVTEATAPREALALARQHFTAEQGLECEGIVSRYERERYARRP